MENKYYIPEISEFFVGFEYEYLAAPNLDRHINNGFIKKVCTPNYLMSAAALIKNYPKAIRVKYLDRSDIESLNLLDHNGNQYIYEEKDNVCFAIWNGKDEWLITYNTTGHYIKNIRHSGGLYNMNSCMMNIFIKNKSELKVFLKQLEIL
jgi:hypothetical protein